MQRIRIVENIMDGRFVERTVDSGMTAGELKRHLNAEGAVVMQDGKQLPDGCLLDDSLLAVVKVIPSGATTMAIIGIAVGVASLVVGAIALSKASAPSMDKVQTSPSLRGSTNQARKDERLPILLGMHRVYPDAAALPFSTYSDDDQYLHQLFCFGYSDASLDESTLKIGETLVSNFDGCSYAQGLGAIYPFRVVENVYSLELRNDGAAVPITRSSASSAWKIQVGIIAPNGLYRYDKDTRKTATVGIRIEWRIPDGAWTTAHDISVTRNSDSYRQMFDITPSGAADGTYEVRVTRTSQEGDSSSCTDSIYLDVIKSFTQNQETSSKIPVSDASACRLLALKIKASDQLNGVVDELNAICTLSARDWDGEGSGAAHWVQGTTRNPASAVLYLLTSSNANPSPVGDTLIDWASFEAFHQFCSSSGFKCDAWITGEFTVRQLCEYIASSCMAEMQVQCDRIAIRIDRAQAGIVQMFTPRNGWSFVMTRSFEDKPVNLVVKFNDAEAGYVEVERTISIDSSNQIVYDEAQDGDSQQIDTFGITSAEHAAKLGALRLKQLHARTRTFTWKSDIEGIVCLPGDVVLLGNDNFLLGLGEARIAKVISTALGVSGIIVDAAFRMVPGTSYGVRIRTSSGQVIGSWAVAENPGKRRKLNFSNPIPLSSGVEEGDLVAVGEYRSETHKVLLTDVTPDQNRSCSFKGIDYAEEVYSPSDSIPAYISGISRYPDDGGRIAVPAQRNQYKEARAASSSIVPSYLGCLVSIPSGNYYDGDYFLLGAALTGYSFGHVYRYSKSSDSWVDSADSAILSAVQYDAMNLARTSGNQVYAYVMYASMLFVQQIYLPPDGALNGSYEEDSEGNPTSGYLFSQGLVKTFGAIMRNCLITGSADFGCAKFEPQKANPYPCTVSSQQGKVLYQFAEQNSLLGALRACTIDTNSSAVFINFSKTPNYSFGGGSILSYNYFAKVYNSSKALLFTAARYDSPNTTDDVNPIASGSVVTIYTGGNKMLLDIPTSSTDLESGRVYSDGNFLKIVP